MAYFLIDLENTHSGGLRGARYLNTGDTVVIFYSESCKELEQGVLKEVFDSGCQLELCKLIKKGPNALDFYIASRIGALLGGGYSGGVVIISGDKGFQAINHYWQNYGPPRRTVHLRPNLEQGILALSEKNARWNQIREALLAVDLTKAVADHAETMRVQRELQALFEGTEQADKLPRIMNILSGQSGTGKVLYLSTLKQFGRKDGLEIYRKLRLLNWNGS